MPLETTTFERAVHLALFIAGALAFAIAALAVLERVAGGERRVIRFTHVALAGALFGALAVTELVFHLLH